MLCILLLGGCCLTWLRFANAHSFGAMQLDLGSLGGGVNLETCKSACLGRVTCQAIDWDRRRATCWIHDDPVNLFLRSPSNDIDQYFVIRSQTPRKTRATI